MEASEAARLAAALEDAGIAIWLDGGWGVDALVEGQTREHDDLDFVVALRRTFAVRRPASAASGASGRPEYTRPVEQPFSERWTPLAIRGTCGPLRLGGCRPKTPSRKAVEPVAVKPELTVVIPAWDVGDELLESIASVRADPEPSELVIVDNASERVLAVPGGVSVVRSARRLTLGQARNLGLKIVTTPFVCFMDADDVLLPPALQILTSALRCDRELVLASGAITLWETSGNIRVPSYLPPRLAYRVQYRRCTLALLQATTRVVPTQGAVVIRTHVLRAVGGFPDVPAGENWALGVSLALAGGIRLDPRPMKLYRVPLDRRTLATSRDRELKQCLGAHRAMRNALRQSPHAGRILKMTSFGLAPIHLALALGERLRSEPRAVRLLKRAASA